MRGYEGYVITQLRNVVPRQGTEIAKLATQGFTKTIEKCSSPTGDGNQSSKNSINTKINIEKCSSPTGDGNT